MEILNTELEENIDGIFRVAGASFEVFYTKDYTRKRLNDKKYWIYVAKEDEQIVGFKIFYEDGDNIYDWLDGVHPDCRRKGIASKLMEKLFSFANERKYKKVTLKTHKGHPEMIEFLRVLGFHRTHIEKDYWGKGLDAIFYEYDLKNYSPSN